MTPDLALLGVRFLRFALAMMLWGTGLYLAFIAPVGVSARLRARLSLLPAAATVGLVVVTALRLPLLAASFGGGWSDATQPHLLGAVLQTWTGNAWIVDAAVCVLLAASLFTARHKWRATTALGGLVLATSALTGHGDMPGGGWGQLHQLNDAVHLLAGGFWLGALPALALTLRQDGAGPPDIRAVERFGVAGQGAVALVIGSGMANAMLINGGTPPRWSSLYDMLLLMKIAVVCAMVGLACINHFHLLPRMAAGSNGAAAAMCRAALIEVALGATAVGLVTIFGMLDTA